MNAYRLLHLIYEFSGHLLAVITNIYFSIRDSFNPPNEKAILFIAHPDDDVLFFHTFIKEMKPYVVLLTTGGIIKRVIPFYRTMKYYGVRYRTFDMHSRAVESEQLISKRIRNILNNSSFTICATHNNEGEYGHVMHCCIHSCVMDNWKGNVLVPYNSVEIVNHPLPQIELEEKRRIIHTYYRGEYPTLQKLEKWIVNEGLIEELAYK